MQGVILTNSTSTLKIFFLKSIFCFLLCLCFSLQVFGQIAAWDFAGNAGSEVTVVATTLNSNLNSTSISRGPRITSTAVGNTYAANGFNVGGTLANAIASGDFFQFTIKPTPAFKTQSK